MILGLRLLVGLVLVLVGCAPTKIKIDTSRVLAEYEVRSVAVMPFDRLTTPQLIDSADPELFVPRGATRSDIRYPVAPPMPGYFEQETIVVPPFAPDKISEMMYRKLTRRGGLKVLSPAEAEQAVRSLGTSSIQTTEQMAKEIARKLQVDAVLAGRVLIYLEREGGRFGARPAIVGFEVKLIAADGMPLWTGNYYEKQRPMTEDFVGFWQHGGGFVSAAELAEYGADHLVRLFPFGIS